MAQLSIPDQYRHGFAELLKLNDDQVRELISAFKEVQPVRSLRSLYASVMSNVESIEHSELDEIVDTIVSLFALRDNLGEPTPEFVGIITRILDHSEFDNLAFSDDKSRESFEAVLTEILEIDSLEKAANGSLLK
jgi:hypothetical protein